MKQTWRFGLPAFLAACILCAHATAQDLPPASPESVGLSAARLARIATTVDQSIQEKRIAGAVTLVARHGRVAWLKAQGMLDREAARPMPADAIFRICSMSKPITSLAVMMLYEEGRFLLDDPVSKYIPEFKNPKVLVKSPAGRSYPIPATREITIRNLLTHTSGLTYQWNGDLGQTYKDANVASGLLPYDGTIGDSVKRLAVLPLLFNPGERFEYSLGVDVLGYLVEVLSGQTFDQFLHTRIFQPLGMRDTSFYPPDEKLARLASTYTWYPEEGLRRFPDTPIVEGPFSYAADYPYHGPKKLYAGGGGLCSTAMDYARFCQLMLNGGKAGSTRLISRKTVELMTSDRLGKIGPDQAFGLGFGIDGVKTPLAELGSPGQYNWGGFFYTAFVVDPKEDMITVFMAQLHPAGDLNLDRLVHVLAYQAITD
ncbi:MAG: serine hydrolase domain-containing protein [Bryobacteraceae bacterium]|jgi:CubicO group peptidase (beta-lactamase class C family)